MSVEALTEFPPYFVSGDTVRVSFSESDYPSSGWGLTVHLRGAALASFTAQAGVSNTFDLVITASQTAALAAGSYAVTFVYTETATTERKTVEFGNVQVLANPTAATVKSAAREALEAMEAALTLISSGMHKSVAFNGQTMTKQDIPVMQEAIARQRAIVAAEDRSIALNSGKSRVTGIGIRFAAT